MPKLTQDLINETKGRKAIVALAEAHGLKASGKTDGIVKRLRDAAEGDLQHIPAFLKREKGEAPSAPEVASEPEATTQDEPFQVFAKETTIAGTPTTAHFIDLGDDREAGPFDTEGQAIAHRDRFYTSKTKTDRKSATSKTAQEPGKMTDKYRAKMVTLVRLPGDDEKLTRQAEGCLEALRAMAIDADAEPDGFNVTQGELVDFLIDDATGPRHFINTTQSPKRIWDFYRKRLIKDGYVTVETA